MRAIRKVAVLGAGTMGAQIAALMANAGIDSYLLDLVPAELTDEEKKQGLSLSSKNVRNRLAALGLKRALETKPPSFFTPGKANRITIGNLEDDLGKIREVDWVIEAIVESIEEKRELMRRVEAFRKPGTIVSSNTSGISVSRIAAGLSDDFRMHFLGTHFFNPPRYLHLLELIPAEETLPEVVSYMIDFAENRLGKGALVCKDTPNFIGNRIGIAGMLYIWHKMLERGLSVEEVDTITGSPSARPKSGTFRTADIVGLDTLVRVAENLQNNLHEDELRNYFKPPEFIKEMQKRNWLGEKSKTGFYKKVTNKKGETELLALDPVNMEHSPRREPSFSSIDATEKIEDIRERFRSLVYSTDRAGEFLWDITATMLIYCANRIPEIADNLVTIDNAMKWGFGWRLGPFEMWDAIGLEKSVERMRSEGRIVPPKIMEMVESGVRFFYQDYRFYDFGLKRYEDTKGSRKILNLALEKKKGSLIRGNQSASLIDIGDSVACVEFHSKANVLDDDVIRIVDFGLSKLESDYEALVIGNSGRYFSAGADLASILKMATDGKFDEIDKSLRRFQSLNTRIKYSPKPVVAAPFKMTLGGGAELVLHSARARASAETYIGLVEVGVGLIPAGGGTKEMLARSFARAAGVAGADLIPFVRRVMETVVMAKVSTSAEDAKDLGFIRRDDSFSMNENFLLYDAKSIALALVQESYRVPERADIIALGRPTFSALVLGLYLWKEAKRITDYEFHIAKKLAYVLAGGDFTSPQIVDEDYILDLEREAFLSLCGEKKTQDRIRHMLRTNKVLRN